MRLLTKYFLVSGLRNGFALSRATTVGIGIVVLLAVIAMAIVLGLHEARVDKQFNKTVQRYQQVADLQILTADSAISTIASVDRSMLGLNSNEYAALIDQLKDNHNIDQLLFAPVAESVDRFSFEMEREMEGMAGYVVRDFPQIALPPSQRSGLMAPVTRVEPFVPARSGYLALDLFSSSTLYDLALSSMQTGKAAVANFSELPAAQAQSTPRLDKTGSTVVIIHSVYQGISVPTNVKSRRNQWRGIYVGFMNLDPLWNMHRAEYSELDVTVVLRAGETAPDRSLLDRLRKSNKSANIVMRVEPGHPGAVFKLAATYPKPLLYTALAALFVLVSGGFLVSILNRIREVRIRSQEFTRLAAKERLRAEQTLAVVGDAVVRTTSDYEITYFNEMARQMFGSCLDAELPPRMDQMLIPAASSSELQDDALLVDPTVVLGAGDYIFRDQDNGDELLVNVQRTETDRIEDEGGAWIFVVRDVGVERAMASELEWRASRDELTGLYNRHAFEVMASRVFSRKTGCSHALCIVDLDQFKIINDTAGHAVGDEMLRRVAETLNSEVRDDDLTARLGGDEFGFLLVDVNEQEIEQINSRMVAAIGGCRVSWSDQVFQVGASIGIALTDDDQWSITDLMHNADKACFAAKKSGRGRSIVFRADDFHINQRESDILWINEIPKAIQGNRFALDVQSIQAVRKITQPGEVREILVRMLSENGEVVAPSDFIPAAERHDLMARIDRWVLHNAFREIARTPFAQNAVLYSINLSSRTLEEQDLGSFVLEQLEQSGVLAEQICFELTETAAVSDVGNASNFLNRMRDLGFKTALDDFGSGLASFRYLRSFPADFLKLDRSMVVEAAEDDRSRRLLEGVVDLCRDMGMLTVAEGIEDKQVYELMKSVGVDYVQGYYISRPQRFLTPENSTVQILSPPDEAVG